MGLGFRVQGLKHFGFNRCRFPGLMQAESQMRRVSSRGRESIPTLLQAPQNNRAAHMVAQQNLTAHTANP